MTETAPAIDDDLPPDEPKVFLSYSRKDRERARGIADALRNRHFGVFRDTDDILPTEEWRERLQQLIEEADTIVFLMSPQSIASEVCAWEVEYATSLNKRIAPIVIQDVEGGDIPPLLARLNFIFCTDRDPFENAIDTLSSALSTDIEWVREHTRLSGLARRWQEAGRPKRLLLRGQDIADAEVWRDSRPKDAPDITSGHIDLIRESRRAAQVRQRGWIAGSLIVALITAGLSIFAVLQSIEADRQRIEAEVQRAEAELQRAEAETQRAEAELQRATAETERDRAEKERARAEEQRDLAERRLREALIERSRRNMADAEGLIATGAQQAAAPLVRDALATATDLADQPLILEAEALARRLLFTDRLFGFLENPHVADIGYADVRISPDGRFIASLHLQNLKVWSFATGQLSPLNVSDVENMAWLPDNRLAVLRSKRQVGAWSSLTVFDAVTGAITAETDHDRQFAEAALLPEHDLVLATEYSDGAHRTLGMELSSGRVLFDRPASGEFRAFDLSDDGELIALAFGQDRGIEVVSRAGQLKREYRGSGDKVRFLPAGRDLVFRDVRHWWIWPEAAEPEGIRHGDDPVDALLVLGEQRVLTRSGLDQVAISSPSGIGGTDFLPVSTVFGLAGVLDEGERFLLRLDQRFAVHDSATGDLVHLIGRVSPPAGGHHLSNDGRYLAIIHQTGLVSVWSTESGRELLALEPEGGGRWVQILDRPVGPVLAVVDGEDRLGLWRIEPYDLFFGNDAPGVGPPVGDSVAVSASFQAPMRQWDLGSATPVRERDGVFLLDTDVPTGRMLYRLPDSRVGITTGTSEEPVQLQVGEWFDAWMLAWHPADRLASHSRGIIEIHDTKTGVRIGALELDTSVDGPQVRTMDFLARNRLAVLMRDGRLLVVDASSGSLISETRLAAPGNQMVVSGSGRFALIGHGLGIWRHDFDTGETRPLAEQDGTVSLRSAGSKTAVLHRFDGETRRSWLIDMESGDTRFDLDWGSSHALGDADRVIVSEDARGGFAIRDARTGDVLHTQPGDGGVGGFPVTPLLSADENWMIAINGGADMVRLIDTRTGEVRARVARRDGFSGLVRPAADFRSVTLTDGIRSGVIDLAVAHLEGGQLSDAIAKRYPAAPVVPDSPKADRCDRMAAFVNDPNARTDGVPYEAISPEALAVCAEAANVAEPDPVTLFQLARVASLHAPDQDANTVSMLEQLADQGYAAAGYTLAVMMLQGRAPADRETLIRRLRNAAEAGAGIAWVMLSRLASAGHIGEDADVLLQNGVDAGLPAAMDEKVRILASTPAGLKQAAELAVRTAEAYGARYQFTAANRMSQLATGFARRLRP